jgi:NTP pyrophosphatase (non-canonical NTP hydrolase)
MRTEVLERAIDQYGLLKQTDMATEEVGELLQSINKLKRVTPEGVPLFSRPTKDSSIKYCLAYWGLCSEIADVKILMYQLETMMCKEAVDLSIERKIDRLEDRLNEGTY